jgi:pyruvate/2-oxoglutarate dehydrogenase complex dihydrolipoamide acyltransferase (E2) component
VKITPVARERRHTLHFLDEIRSFAPVFLDTEIDMTRVREHRGAVRNHGPRYSLVTYLLYTSARVIATHPEANAAIRGHIRPRVARYTAVNGKFTLDKSLGGHRVVLSAVIPALQRASLDDIQRHIDRYREGDPATMAEFAGVRMLHRLPWLLGSAAFRFSVRPLTRRADALGTLAVTSLGHRPVDGFYSVGGTTITLGAGRVMDRPVVRDGQVGIAPIMRLSLAFDHRVIDGAEAADVLADIKDALESFRVPDESPGAPARGGAAVVPEAAGRGGFLAGSEDRE